MPLDEPSRLVGAPPHLGDSQVKSSMPRSTSHNSWLNASHTRALIKPELDQYRPNDRMADLGPSRHGQRSSLSPRMFNNTEEYFSKHPVSSRQLDDLSQICQDIADGSPRYTLIDKLFRSSAFLRAARARDILRDTKSHSSLSDLWDELEFYKFYWNVNDLNKKVIIKKYTQYVKDESLLSSYKSYALLGLSHMAYLASIPMKIVVDVIDRYTKNHDLDSPIRSLAIIPFVPKMPVQFDIYGFIVFLTWPILGLLFSPFLRELASILLRETYSSFCQLFSFGKLNSEITDSNVKSVASETIAPGGIFGSWNFKSLISSLECMWPSSNREHGNVKKD